MISSCKVINSYVHQFPEKGHGVVAFFGATQFAEGEWVKPESKSKIIPPQQSSLRAQATSRKESSRSRFSPAASPRMTPSSSVDQLKSSGSSSNLANSGSKRQSPKDEAKHISKLTAPTPRTPPAHEKVKVRSSRLTPYTKRISSSALSSPRNTLQSHRQRITSSAIKQPSNVVEKQQQSQQIPATNSASEDVDTGTSGHDTSTDAVREMVKKMEEFLRKEILLGENARLRPVDRIKVELVDIEPIEPDSAGGKRKPNFGATDRNRTRPSTLSIPAVRPVGMEEGSELEYLRIENKELSDKLINLREKRKEDQRKLVEYERNRIQLQALLEYKAKMTEAHTDLQRKLQEKDRELREVLASKANEREDVNDIEEQLELITLDKEMAEERAEMLQVSSTLTAIHSLLSLLA
ncbi:unnamed protein product [Anisakis simplex]|uniref:Dynactin subunit 1 (inferred by orthology to a human protein) n=1 Tax=Anisakis simplex TaxID=6269 RepID=A0A158PPP6_ANISI|nr:unnamed protein product [Anisakis simplex]